MAKIIKKKVIKNKKLLKIVKKKTKESSLEEFQ